MTFESGASSAREDSFFTFLPILTFSLKRIRYFRINQNFSYNHFFRQRTLTITSFPLIAAERRSDAGRSRRELSEPSRNCEGEFRSRPASRAAQRCPKGRRTRGRLLLITFLGDTRKAIGCQAAPGEFDPEKFGSVKPKSIRRNALRFSPCEVLEAQRRLFAGEAPAPQKKKKKTKPAADFSAAGQ
jgi:hypothetical protein